MSITTTVVSTLEELETTAGLAHQIWHEYYTDILGEAQVNYMVNTMQNAEAMKKQIENGMVYCNIYWQGKVAGYFAVELQGDKLFLSKFYISQAFRGKGIFKAVLGEIISHSQGMQCVYLTVNKGNKNAIEAYKKLGFTQTDAIETNIGNGFIMDDYVMQKNI